LGDKVEDIDSHTARSVAKNPDGTYKHKYRLELTPDGRTQSRWVLTPKIHDHISQEDNVTSTVLPNNPMRDLEKGALGGVLHLQPAITCSDQEKEFTPSLDHISQEDKVTSTEVLPEPQGTSNAGTVPADIATPMPWRKVII
jgi:hypothetical protein